MTFILDGENPPVVLSRLKHVAVHQ